MATRLSYWAETINLLHHKQINDKKQKLVIDTVMCLTHDIQQALNNNNRKNRFCADPTPQNHNQISYQNSE